MKKLIPVRALGKHAESPGRTSEKNNSVKLVIAGEFGQVLSWVTKVRRCQTAEVSQQKC